MGMNERILEIAKQANVLADFGDDITVGRYSIGGSYEQMEQFAELIVKECIDYCGENLSKTVGGALKIHFGVEE
jgi:hypothetical protein